MTSGSSSSLFGWLVEGVLLVSVGGLGFIGNIMCIITFSKMAIQKNFHRLMLALSIFDLIYIAASMALFGIPTLYPWLYTTKVFKRLILFLLPTIHIGLTGSIYLTVAIALERYTTVCHPFFKISHAWSAWTYIVPISIFSILYNIPKCLELEVNSHVVNVTETWDNQTNITDFDEVFNITVEKEIERVDPTNLRINPTYIQVYIIYMNLVVHGIIPLLLLLILNIFIYRQLRRHHNLVTIHGQSNLQLREVRLSQVSLLIVVIFILCHSLRWIPNIWELRQAGAKKGELIWPGWVQYITQLSHLATVVNSSVNFFIYLAKHPSLFCLLGNRGISENNQLSTVALTNTIGGASNGHILLQDVRTSTSCMANINGTPSSETFKHSSMCSLPRGARKYNEVSPMDEKASSTLL